MSRRYGSAASGKAVFKGKRKGWGRREHGCRVCWWGLCLTNRHAFYGFFREKRLESCLFSVLTNHTHARNTRDPRRCVGSVWPPARPEHGVCLCV